MKAYRQFFLFLLSLILCLGIVMGFNYYTNPFGVFSANHWYSYEMTRNPRTAKISYIHEHDYNAYVVGSSGSSAFVVEDLNHATGCNFYNAFYYGADMKDAVKTIEYLVKYKNPKEILFPITFSFAENYDKGEDDLSYKTSDLLEGNVNPVFRLKYLLANVKYGYEKIKSQKEDRYLPKPFDVFLPESGNYDKRVRDVERITNPYTYLEKYPEFTYQKAAIEMPHQKDFFHDLSYVVNLCKEKNIPLRVVMYPLYETAFAAYHPEDIKTFYQNLGEITEYWDFTFSSVSKEPRFFYDTAHYRNAIGKMMVAKIYGQENQYVPNDFGKFVEKHSPVSIPATETTNTIESFDLPVLIYHHFTEEEEDNPLTVTKEKLKEHLNWLKEAGYQTISVEELINYVNTPADLPEKAVLITIDDGYRSNYEIAYPLLKENKAKATIFAIGHSVGKDTYKETGKKILPHFSIEEGREMIASGLISIQSHTMDMHQSYDLEEDKTKVRETVLPLENENETEYIRHFRQDIQSSIRQIEEEFGNPSIAFSYPRGAADELAEVLLAENGFQVTFGTEVGRNLILKGLPQSLVQLKRYNMTNQTTKEGLMEYLGE